MPLSVPMVDVAAKRWIEPRMKNEHNRFPNFGGREHNVEHVPPEPAPGPPGAQDIAAEPVLSARAEHLTPVTPGRPAVGAGRRILSGAGEEHT